MQFNIEATPPEDSENKLNGSSEFEQDFEDLSSMLEQLSSEDDLDSEQKFWNSLSDPKEVQYVLTKLMYPSYDTNDLALAVGVKKSSVRKFDRNNKLQAYIRDKFRERAERYIYQEQDSFRKISSVLQVELETRLVKTQNGRTSAEILLGKGFNEREVRLILENRIEGISMKDLIKLKMDVPHNIIKLKSGIKDTGDDAEVIEEMSVLYKRYRRRVENIDVTSFDPNAVAGFNLVNIETKKSEIIDVPTNVEDNSETQEKV